MLAAEKLAYFGTRAHRRAFGLDGAMRFRHSAGLKQDAIEIHPEKDYPIGFCKAEDECRYYLEHLKERSTVVKKSFTTAADGKQYDTAFYNLDAIISVGYRVKSHGNRSRGTPSGLSRR